MAGSPWVRTIRMLLSLMYRQEGRKGRHERKERRKEGRK
jgi:hypothetical protein